MKHLLLTAIAALATATATAADGVPFLDTARPDKFVYFDIHAGVGASTMRQNYAEAVPDCGDFTLTPGTMTHFGVGAELPIRRFFGIGTGVDFDIDNFYYSMTILQPADGTLNTLYTRNHYYWVNIPVYLSFRFNLGGDVRWQNEAGMYLAIGAGGTTRTKAYTSSTNQLGQSQVTETNYKRDFFKDKEAIINGVRNADWGLHVGTGLVFKSHVSLKCILRAGLRDVAQNFGVLKIRNHTLTALVQAAYIF